MQDAPTVERAGGGWAQRPNFPAEILSSLHDLNLRFLELAAAPEGAWRICWAPDLPDGAAEALAALSPDERAAAARCPYALFDLRFHDDAHWQSRLHDAGPWRVAEEPAEGGEPANFVRLALFYAWHLASTKSSAARLLLGMSERTAAAFRAATLNCIPGLVASETGNLGARWRTSGRFWRALASAAARPDAHRLQRIRLFGVQLAAAALLP